MKKRIITILTCILLACFSSFIFTACNNNDAGENNQDSEIKLIYNTYVAEMQESGNTPLSYE